MVEIIDDGVGFDTDDLKKDKKEHCGIKNVKERLMFYGNELKIKSEKGKGTVATIIVNKNKK